MSESTFDITATLSEPYYTAGSAANLENGAFPVSIDGRPFQLDLQSQQFTRRSIDLINTQQAESGSDGAAIAPEVWRRVFESWHSGAGQVRADRKDSIDTRFNASFGIDPWTKYRLSLLNKTEQLRSLSAGQDALIESIGRSLFVAQGSNVYLYADPVTSGSSTTKSITDNAVSSTTDGQNYYVLDSAGKIHRYDGVAGTWNDAWGTVASPQAGRMMIAYVKGFILVGNGAVLLDYTTPGTPATVYTHRLSGWTWKAASEGQTVIYVLGGMGDRWLIHRVGIQSSGSALDAPIVAASLPEGEYAYTISTYLGYVLIGVHTGWRFALAAGDGSLTYGQVVRTPLPVRCFEGQGSFVWFGLSQGLAVSSTEPYQGTIWSERPGLGRADLATFVGQVTPAAASDVYASGVYGETTDVVTVGTETDGIGWRVFVVKEKGVYIERSVLVDSGWLRQGAMSFNSTDEKMGLYAQAVHDSLAGSVSLSVAVDQSDTFNEIGSNAGSGSSTMGNMDYSQSFRSLEFKYTLTSNAAHDDGPALRRTEMRAVNVPGRATEWSIPLFLHDVIEAEGTTLSRDPGEDFDYLLDLIYTKRPFIYREGARTFRLFARDFTWSPYQITSDASTFKGTFVLYAREIT